MAAQAPGLVKSLVTVPAGPVAFTGVRLFDADATRFLTDQTVVVDKGVITAVGARASIAVPAGAQVIDGRGKTLDPGPVGLPHARRRRLHRPAGVVDGRDLGARSRQRRRAHHRSPQPSGRGRAAVAARLSLLAHRRQGTYTAQVANVATSEAEAIALVDKAKANGFTGIKFYGTFNAAWLPASIREAHKLGLHVHGHIPAGIRPMDAINAGYDEITHINWVMMQAMPDSVIPVSNGIMRFEGPGRYAKDVNLEGPAIKTIIGAMTSKHIYSDPTMVAFESLYVPENGDLSPSYAPFVGTMPPTTERGFRSGGFAVPKGLTRADYRASWAKMVGLLGLMHKAGVPIVAGTDGAGIELVHELEIYVQAGLQPGGSAGGGDHRAGAAGRPGREDRFDQGRQGRRSGAGRRRSVDAHRRPARRRASSCWTASCSMRTRCAPRPGSRAGPRRRICPDHEGTKHKEHTKKTGLNKTILLRDASCASCFRGYSTSRSPRSCLMRITRLVVLFAVLFTLGVAAQNAPAPATITPRLDTPQARVIVATLQPRTPSIARNGHATNRVLIYLDDGVMTVTRRRPADENRVPPRRRALAPGGWSLHRREHQRSSDSHSRGRPERCARRSGAGIQARSGDRGRPALQGGARERAGARAPRPLRTAREGRDARAHPEPRRPVPERSARREGRRRARGRSGDPRGRERLDRPADRIAVELK